MKAWLAPLNAHAGWIFILGSLLVGAWHARQWRKDRSLAMRLRQAPRQPPSLEQTPLVSVLVAAWSEAEMIGEHIASFLALRYPRKELILCAGGPDGTFQLAGAHRSEQVRVLEQHPGEGKQRALRRCLDEASGEIIFLTDADCLLDDEAFERTLAPLLLEDEDVATGTSRPLVRQLDHPFVRHQWYTNLFVEARQPAYMTGILGRNAALRRQALQRVGGFSAEVHTGTDYHTGKQLLAQGYRIRSVPDSTVQTRYPENFRTYWRKQSRWVRNLMVHGPAFGAYHEVAMALRTGLVGAAMLILPVASVAAGPFVLAVWGALLALALLARLRYARFARAYLGIGIPALQYLWMPAYLFVDVVAWSLALLDVVARPHRW